MADDLRQWLDAGTPEGSPEPDDDRPHTGRRIRVGALLTALVAPWLLLAVALLTGGAHGAPAPVDRPARSAPTAPPGPHRAPATSAPPGTSPARPSATDPTGRRRPASVPTSVAPTAVRLVRDAVTRGGGRTTSAVDVAAAEHPRLVAPGTWLVRVHAVVLHGDRRRWRRSTHDVWAVPIGRRGDGLVGLEHPWRVASLDTPVARAAWRPAAVDRDRVRAALRRAGQAAPADLAVERHPTEPTIIRASAGDDRRVWLARGRTLQVLGAPSPGASP